MSVIGRRTKAKAGLGAAKAAAKRPQLVLMGAKTGARLAVPVGKAGLKASRFLVRRRARRRVHQLQRASGTVGELLAVQAPRVAYDLGLAEPPKPKRPAPRVAAGVVLGASAVYFLQPEHGKERRERVAQLVS
jgi:hypothetical protein